MSCPLTICFNNDCHRYMYKYNPATQVTVGVVTQFDQVCKTHGLWDRSVDVLGAEKKQTWACPTKD